MKRCSSCRDDKYPSQFYRDRRALDGLHSECMECTKAMNRAWRQRNREQIRVNAKAYYRANSAAHQATMKALRARHRKAKKTRPARFSGYGAEVADQDGE